MSVTFSISGTVQDADAPDLRASLKLRYATNSNPNPTDAQLRTAMENAWREELRGMVLQYRRDQAAVVPPVVT